MAYPPVVIFMGGQQLDGYTAMSLTRSKEDLTGSLTVDVFFNHLPSAPTIVDAAIANEVTVYIGGHLAFKGTVDKRRGSGIRHGKAGSTEGTVDAGPSAGAGEGSSRSVSIGPNEYTVKITARGSTKVLIDASHQHDPTNMLKPTTLKAIKKLVEPFNIQLEFIGTDIEIDKIRFRDGAKVLDELQRIAVENCYYMYETRDGKLRITDDIGIGSGEALILGDNILTFSAEQTMEFAKSEITVKGQRTPKDMWGKKAVLDNTVKITTDEWAPAYTPLTVQHYGDATKAALERRGRFEANKRSSKSKNVSIEVFHVQSRSGAPWDVGQLHFVEVPPEGIFETFECTAIEYTVNNKDTLKTTLTLSPPPVGGGAGGGGLAAFENASSDNALFAALRKAATHVSFVPGKYPAPWSGPVLAVRTVSLAAEIIAKLAGLTSLARVAGDGEDAKPPLELPPNFNTQSDNT